MLIVGALCGVARGFVWVIGRTRDFRAGLRHGYELAWRVSFSACWQ